MLTALLMSGAAGAAKIDGKLAMAVSTDRTIPNPEAGLRRRFERDACIVGGIRPQGTLLGMGRETGRGRVSSSVRLLRAVTNLGPATC